ncbi:MAG: glycosyltransferase family 2 protein [Thermoflexales bacterium]
MLDLAVVIVSWNVRDLLRTCLRSCLDDLKGSGLQGRIVVVDSASSDGTPALVRAEFGEVELIASEDNIGFVKGNNLSLRRLGFGGHATAADHPRYVWLLNPDTRVHPGAIKSLLDFMAATPRCGLCGPKLENPDGSLQMGAFAFPGLAQLLIETQPRLARFRDTRLDGRYPLAWLERNTPFRIGSPLGAAMLARAEAIEQVGLLDEGFEMYCEEIDWAMRMRQAGWERWCVPTAVVTHYGGASSGQASARTEVIKWRSRRRYFAKHYGALRRAIALRIARGR